MLEDNYILEYINIFNSINITEDEKNKINNKLFNNVSLINY